MQRGELLLAWPNDLLETQSRLRMNSDLLRRALWNALGAKVVKDDLKGPEKHASIIEKLSCFKGSWSFNFAYIVVIETRDRIDVQN
jgi:hypothetical protein